jgi:hypothetical protein
MEEVLFGEVEESYKRFEKRIDERKVDDAILQK